MITLEDCMLISKLFSCNQTRSALLKLCLQPGIVAFMFH